MPGFVKEALQKFYHPTPIRPHHSPHQWIAPNYGSTSSLLAHYTDESPAINPQEEKIVHKVVQKFLYYAHEVDQGMLVTLNRISA